ncbi:DUF2809 domain-containing protein [Bacillus sp. DNRA2]|nr:DUF2809 domain-containing protein [Bacillus sp. DNRA2]
MGSRKTVQSRSQRVIYFIAIIITILLGLASRQYAAMLPFFVAEHAGDALWGMMVYFGFRFLLISKKVGWSFLFSIIFSFAIEFSQLYQAEWLNDIRATVLGALIWGKGFLFIDLVRYTTGILIGAGIDKLLKKG